MSIFFFKQKTAYEMRISDWSSDVCSSDLVQLLDRLGAADESRHRRGANQVGDPLGGLRIARPELRRQPALERWLDLPFDTVLAERPSARSHQRSAGTESARTFMSRGAACQSNNTVTI